MRTGPAEPTALQAPPGIFAGSDGDDRRVRAGIQSARAGVAVRDDVRARIDEGSLGYGRRTPGLSQPGVRQGTQGFTVQTELRRFSLLHGSILFKGFPASGHGALGVSRRAILRRRAGIQGARAGVAVRNDVRTGFDERYRDYGRAIGLPQTVLPHRA